MAQIAITKNYADGEILLEADLDEIKTDVETFLNTTKINDDNIQDGGITGTDKIAAGSVGEANLASSSVATAKIADSAVTTAKINDLAVTTAKVAAGAITYAKMTLSSGDIPTAKLAADAGITTGMIGAAQVTPAKLSTRLQSVANASTPITTSANAAVSFTGTGRPVMILLSATSNDGTNGFYCAAASGASNLGIYKNGSLMTTPQRFGTPSFRFTSYQYLDTTGYTGTVTYDLRSDADNINLAGGTLTLTAIEL